MTSDPGGRPSLRARVFLRDPDFSFAGELEAADADDVWRQTQRDPSIAGRNLRDGDIVFIGDQYLELNGDGGWSLLVPGPITERLYRLAVSEERGAT